MRSIRSLLVVPLLGLLDCGSITQAPSTTPTNSCILGTSCTSYCPPGSIHCTPSELRCSATLSGNACVSNVPSTNLAVLVSVPEGAAFQSGQALTFVLQDNDLHCTTNSVCSGASQNCARNTNATIPCLQLQPASQVSGAYVAGPVDESFEGLNATGDTSIPVQTTFIPKWPPHLTTPPCGVQKVAASLNLPLSNITALTASTNEFGLSSPSGLDGPLFAWSAFLPLSPSYEAADNYFVSSVPVVPYDQYIAPLTDSSVVIGTVSPESPAASVTVSVSGIPNPEGWTTYIREVASPQRIVSSRGSLSGGPTATATLYSSTVTAMPPEMTLDDYLFIVSPPAGSPLPQLFQNAETIGLEEPTATASLGYPRIPPAVTITGFATAGGMPVASTLHFVATSLYSIPNNSSSCTLDRGTSLTYDYLYVPPTRTPDGGAEPAGKFTVTLPQGIYNVIVDPGPNLTVAKTLLLNFEVTSPELCSAPQGQVFNKSIPMGDPIPVSSRILITDGRPLVNAEVTLTPAATLLQESNSRTGQLLLSQTDWPRSVSVVTLGDGSFNAKVDPGAYDLTVRPVAGTGLPWIVYPDFTAASSASGTSQDLPQKLYVPAPAPLGPLTIHDVNDNPVAQAVVRIYGFTGSGCTAQAPALQIGEAVTDDTGTFQVLLAPLPFQPASP